jgi:WhiB family transcriptional regulator, redox-sensing transcriptional regulator
MYEWPSARPAARGARGRDAIVRADPADEDPWHQAAACRFADPELFFPVSESGRAMEQIARAKAVCARCPVQGQCRAYALRARERHGIWGGMTESERCQSWTAAG